MKPWRSKNFPLSLSWPSGVACIRKNDTRLPFFGLHAGNVSDVRSAGMPRRIAGARLLFHTYIYTRDEISQERFVRYILLA